MRPQESWCKTPQGLTWLVHLGLYIPNTERWSTHCDWTCNIRGTLNKLHINNHQTCWDVLFNELHKGSGVIRTRNCPPSVSQQMPLALKSFGTALTPVQHNLSYLVLYPCLFCFPESLTVWIIHTNVSNLSFNKLQSSHCFPAMRVTGQQQ